MAISKIQKQCAVCDQVFIPKTIDSVYCSKKCSDAAYRRKRAKKKKEEEQKKITDKIPDNRQYISVPEAVAMFGVAKSTLYRLIRKNRIPAINLGTRLIRIDRDKMKEMFSARQTPIVKKTKTRKTYSLEPEDCYTVGEIIKKFGVSDSSVRKHIREHSIPTRQIGKYVYAPKSEIDSIYG